VRVFALLFAGLGFSLQSARVVYNLGHVLFRPRHPFISVGVVLPTACQLLLRLPFRFQLLQVVHLIRSRTRMPAHPLLLLMVEINPQLLTDLGLVHLADHLCIRPLLLIDFLQFHHSLLLLLKICRFNLRLEHWLVS